MWSWWLGSMTAWDSRYSLGKFESWKQPFHTLSVDSCWIQLGTKDSRDSDPKSTTFNYHIQQLVWLFSSLWEGMEVNRERVAWSTVVSSGSAVGRAPMSNPTRWLSQQYYIILYIILVYIYTLYTRIINAPEGLSDAHQPYQGLVTPLFRLGLPRSEHLESPP